jgi:antitoxin ParD1/3/4
MQIDRQMIASRTNSRYWHCLHEMETAVAHSVELGSSLEDFVASLVASGRYNSKSEVLREGVRLLLERELSLSVLDAAITRGLAYAEAGRVKPAFKIFDRLEAKYRALTQAEAG